jgi:hypothetical protein
MGFLALVFSRTPRSNPPHVPTLSAARRFLMSCGGVGQRGR